MQFKCWSIVECRSNVLRVLDVTKFRHRRRLRSRAKVSLFTCVHFERLKRHGSHLPLQSLHSKRREITYCIRVSSCTPVLDFLLHSLVASSGSLGNFMRVSTAIRVPRTSNRRAPAHLDVSPEQFCVRSSRRVPRESWLSRILVCRWLCRASTSLCGPKSSTRAISRIARLNCLLA